MTPPKNGGQNGDSAVDRIYRELRQSILKGNFRAGEHLREQHLAQLFAASRTPVREAIRRLQSEGLVIQEANRGANVRRFTREEILGIYDLRSLLEGYAARKTAQNVTPEVLHKLSGLNAEMAALTEKLPPGTVGEASEAADIDLIQRIVEVNQEFHREVANASGNPFLVTVLATVIQTPLVYRSMQFYGRHGVEVSVRHHGELVQAFQQRDPEWAEVIMRKHVYHGRQVLFDHLEEIGIDS